MTGEPKCDFVAVLPQKSIFTRIATIILIAATLVSLSAAVGIVYHLGPAGLTSKPIYLFAFIGALVASAVLLFLSRCSPDLRKGSVVSLFIFLAGTFGAEMYLSRPAVVDYRIRDMKALGVSFDERQPKDVVFDARRKGTHLKLASFPSDFQARRFIFEGKPIVPFSSPPSSQIVQCNESGEYVIAQTDEAGFYNPRGAWADGGRPEILMVGDSYTEGWCVSPQRSFAGIIRAAYPSALNLGRGGLGPLSQLALVREFVPDLRPRYILWIFFENDIQNLYSERHSEVLQKYLNDPSFSQELYANRYRIAEAVDVFIARHLSDLELRNRIPFFGIRHQLNHLLEKISAPSFDPKNWSDEREFGQLIELFRNAMLRTKTVADAAGSKILFVYLREFGIEGIGQFAHFAKTRPKVLEIVDRLGIAYYETGVDVLRAVGDGRELHRLSSKHSLDDPRNLVRHYNAFGHKLVGDLIVRKLSDFPDLTKSAP